MKKYISFGRFNKNHIYITLSIIFLILKDIISGYNYNDTFIEVVNKNARENFGEHYLINHIFCYIGTFFISTILYIKEINFLRKSKKSENIIKKEKEKQLDIKKTKEIKISYIHNSVNSVKDIIFSKKTLYCFLLLMVVWIIEEHLFEMYTMFKDLDFWMVEIIIVSLIMSDMFHFNIFRHHILTFIFNCIPIILKIFTIILSFKDENNQNFNCDNNINYQYDYSCECFNNNINRMNNNIYNDTYNNANCDSKRLKNIYVVFNWLVPIGIIIYLFLITLRSYINSKIKWFMDLKYISANKLLMIYGFFGAFFCSIACIIATYKECEETFSNNKNLYDYICILNKDDDKNNVKKKYFDNIFIYYQNFERNEIFRILCHVLFYFLHKYYSILIIKFFTPVHLILSFPVSYFFLKIIMVINTLIKNKTFFNDIPIKYKSEKLFLDFAGDITSIIGFLVYLEIIELNFCKFNYNLRRNIINRGINELDDNCDDRNSSYYQDEDVELGTIVSSDSNES